MTWRDIRVAVGAAVLGLAIITAIAAVSLTALQGQSSGGGPRGGALISIPTAAPVVPNEDGLVFCHLALLSGRLVAHPEWGIAVDGAVVIWPNGYVGRIAGDRIELLDERGRVVARTGDHIEAGGGQATVNGVQGFGVCGGVQNVQPAQP